MEQELKRLNKFIGETGHCSRREADDLIENGRVTVNGQPAVMGMKVTADAEVRIDGKLIREPHEQPVYIALHKPPGIECTTNLEVKDNIIDYLNYPKRVFPIGRLDKASEGLILLTNDGDIVNKILRARNNHEKEYLVTVDKPISPRFISRMAAGVPILDTVTRECEVEQTGKNTFRIILTQGLNRQIRRMCEFLGYEVTRLIRTRIINIKLDLPLGRHRELTADEIAQLNELIASSGKTEEASLPKIDKKTSAENPGDRKPYDKRQREPRNVERRDFTRKEDSKTFRQDKPARENRFVKRDDTKAFRPKSNQDDVAKTPKRKIEFLNRDDAKPSNANYSQREDAATSQDSQATPSREFKPAPGKRKIEFIKKDDPDYRNKGEY